MEEIKRMYERQKAGRVKSMIIFLVIYVLMIGVISLFYGNPFTHKEEVLFFETIQKGWISEKIYLLLVCAGIGLIVGIGNVIYEIMQNFKMFDQILLQKCDVQEYLNNMEYAVSYGKQLDFKGFQKTIFMLAQQKYVLAMAADWKTEDAKRYLDSEWVGKKDSRVYQRTSANVRLIHSYRHQDAEEFLSVFAMHKVFWKDRMFIAEKLILEKQYLKAEELLSRDKEKFLYNEVIRNYLLGGCYDKLGEQESAKKYMEYVKQYGNTMPCKKQAQEWLETKLQGRLISI